MSELADLTGRLRDLDEDAQSLAYDLGNPIAPRLELGDLLRRELDLDMSTFTEQLRLDALVEEITRIVLEPYADQAGELAYALDELVGPVHVDDREGFLCLDCGEDTLELGEYYMLEEEVWAATGVDPDGGMLCIGCVEERLGRRLQPADFLDIEMNHHESKSARLRSRVLGLEEAAAAA